MNLDSSLAEVILGSKGQAIDFYLQSMERHAYFMGSVLVEQNGEILLRKGYGQANETSKNDPQTKFQIASITKQFTAAAIMKLHEEKKIDLDVSLNSYLPKQYQCSKWHDVTVHHLLAHQAGIPNYTDCDDYWNICQGLTVDAVLEKAKRQHLEFSPGCDYCYSNTGYELLGKIIEEQSHLTYEEFIKQKLLIPAGMTSSGLRDAHHVPSPPMALGYYVENLKVVKDPRDEFAVLYSDGGMYSTVVDLAKWSKVLEGHSQVLSADSVKLMIKKEYGLVVDQFLGHKRIHHNGSVAGFYADFCLYPQDHLLIVVLGNNVDFVADYITANLSKFLLKNTPLVMIETDAKKCNVAPYKHSFFSVEHEDDEYTFKLRNDQLVLQEDDDVIQCCVLTNGHLFIPSEGTEYVRQKDGLLFVYNCDGERIDILEL